MAKKSAKKKKRPPEAPAEAAANGQAKNDKIDRVAELMAASRAVKYLKPDERVYCAVEECGKKLEKGRTYYCRAHDVWPE